jgi:hypothetical protein
MVGKPVQHLLPKTNRSRRVINPGPSWAPGSFISLCYYYGSAAHSVFQHRNVSVPVFARDSLSAEILIRARMPTVQLIGVRRVSRRD